MEKTYTIKKGNHSASGLNFKMHSGIESIRFSITPHENCLYDLGNNNNYDINKFFGLTFGFDPLKNSFRIGSNCAKQNGAIQYYYYIHNKGLRVPAPTDDPFKTLLFETLPKVESLFTAYLNRSGNDITLLTPNSPQALIIPFNFSGVPNYGVYNHFYFGGDQTAPHDMSMTLKTF